VTTPTLAPPPFPPPPWQTPPPWQAPPPAPAPPNRNRTYALALAILAAVIPLAAVGWFLVSGAHPAAAPVPVPTKPSVAVDNAIVNIDGVIPIGTIAGTGMVLTSNGIVLTNNHVVANTTSLTAQLAGRGPIYPAVVIGVDPTQDVAVIQLVGASGLPVTPFDLSGSLAVGDPVTGKGNALGRNGAPVVATGNVTSLDETIEVQDEEATVIETLDGVICFNAPIQPGDSGGPLLNASGSVIGMDTAGSLTTGTAPATWGCAIPITRAMTIAQQIRAGTPSPYFESGHRGILGVAVGTGSGGTRVVDVTAGDAAAAAGIVDGDVITSVAAIPVTTIASLNQAMQDRRPGDDVAVTWTDTHGAHHSATVVLSAGPPA
jgi:S1-C subfamily serine protease